MREAFSLGDAFRRLVNTSGNNLRVCCPGIITSIGMNDRVSVRLAVGDKREEKIHEPPVLRNVPLVCIGNPRILTRYPAMVGDPVLVLFGDRDLDDWKRKDGVGIATPTTERSHDINDSIAIPIAWGSSTLTSLEVLSLIKQIIQALSVSVGVTPGAPCPFVPIMTTLLAQLTALGIK